MACFCMTDEEEEEDETTDEEETSAQKDAGEGGEEQSSFIEEAQDEGTQEEADEEGIKEFDPFDDPVNDPNYEESMEAEDATDGSDEAETSNQQEAEEEAEVQSFSKDRCYTEEDQDEDTQEEEEDELEFDPFDDPINDPNYEEGMETEDTEEEDATEDGSQADNLEEEDALFNILPSRFAFSSFLANPPNKAALSKAVDHAISADIQAHYSKKRPRFFDTYCPLESKKPKSFSVGEGTNSCTDSCCPPWLSRTLSSIEVSLHMLSPEAIRKQKLTYPDLRKLSTATMVLLEYTEAAIHNARERERDSHKQEIEGMQVEMEKRRRENESKLSAKHAKYRKLKKNLGQHQKYRRAESNKATEESTLRQTVLKFEREKEAMKVTHMLEREAWTALHESQVKDLKNQLAEQKQHAFCSNCREKHRDVVIVPCFHLEYCLSCLLRHREENGNTCPRCEAPIRGFCMSTSAHTRQ